MHLAILFEVFYFCFNIAFKFKKKYLNINVTLLWLILKWYTILEDFFLLDRVRYRDDVMMTLKFDWSNLKTLISG